MMPVQLYETLFLLDSNKLSADADGVRNHLQAGLEKYGAEIVISRPWDDRKLSYPIKNQKKGAYHNIYYRMDSLKQLPLEADLKLNEVVLRHLTLAVDPKWSEVVLDAARNDTSPAFAVRGMQEEAGPMDVNPNLPEGGIPEGEAVTAATAARRPRREMAEKPE
jgi:small subunit ribosomal protein S6